MMTPYTVPEGLSESGCQEKKQTSRIEKKDQFVDLLDLIGIERLQKMQQCFYDVTGFTNGCLDVEGNLLSSAGMPETVCMEMIRKSSVGLERCRKLVKECLDRSNLKESTVVNCHAGMLDGRIPIKVDGKILGVLVIGQLFEVPPEKEQTLAYGKEMGLDPEAYWQGIQKVKIVPRKKVETAAMLLEFMGAEIAEMASANLRLRQEIFAREKAEAELKRLNKALMEMNCALEQERNIFIAGNVVIFKRRNESGWPVEYVSPNVTQVLGYEENEFLSGSVLYADLILPQHLDSVAEEVHFHTEKGSSHFSHDPYCIIGKEGNHIWLDDFTTIIRNDQGAVTHYQGYVVNISKRMAAEKEARSHLQFTKTLLETIPSPVFYKDRAGRYIGCNKAFEDFTRKKRSEMIGRTVCEMAADNIAFQYEMKNLELFEGSVHQIYEWKVPNVEGDLKTVILNKATFYDEEGNIGGLIGIITDISEQAQREKALRESEERFRLLFEQARDAIFLTTMEGCFVMVNQQACNNLGYSRDELLGMATHEVEIGRPEETLRSLYMEIRQGRTQREWGVHRRKDGTTYPVEVTLCSYTQQDQRFFLAVARDMSEQKRAEEEREALIEELQTALSEIKQLSGLLPICSSCKKIRDDKGYWNLLEAYIQDRADVRFSHGICPSCIKAMYGDEEWFDANDYIDHPGVLSDEDENDE